MILGLVIAMTNLTIHSNTRCFNTLEEAVTFHHVKKTTSHTTDVLKLLGYGFDTYRHRVEFHYIGVHTNFKEGNKTVEVCQTQEVSGVKYHEIQITVIPDKTYWVEAQ